MDMNTRGPITPPRMPSPREEAIIPVTDNDFVRSQDEIVEASPSRSESRAYAHSSFVPPPPELFWPPRAPSNDTGIRGLAPPPQWRNGSAPHVYAGYGFRYDNKRVGGDDMDKLAELLKEHDRMKVDKCNGDIDSLLILPDPALASATLLAQLVLHFDGNEALQASGFSFSPFPSGPAAIDIIVNAFWFISLLCSILVACLGIFFKQWLLDFLDINCSSSEEWVRVRQVRHDSLLRWRVFELAAFLPLLLQFALLLFLIGLALFLQPINVIVGWIVSAGVITWIAALAFIITVPMVSSSCPYEIRFFRQVAKHVRGTLARLWYGLHWRQKLGYENPFYRFPGDEQGIRREQKLDVDVVIGADASLKDNTVLQDILRHCVESFGLKSTLKFIREVMAHRLERPISHLREIKPEDYKLIPRQVLDVLLDILCDAIGELVSDDLVPHLISNTDQYKEIVELIWGFYALVDYCDESGRHEPLQAWPSAIRWVQSGLLPDFCLDPPVAGRGLENASADMVKLGAQDFVRIIMEYPNIPTANGSIETRNTAVKSFLRAAKDLLLNTNKDGADIATLTSLTRAVFDWLASDSISPETLRECSEDLRTFVTTLLPLIQKPHIIAEFDDAKYKDITSDASRALTALSKLNSTVTCLVSEEVVGWLKGLCTSESDFELNDGDGIKS